MRNTQRMRAVSGAILLAMITICAFGPHLFAQGKRFQSPQAWSFGVMGDTQWTASSDPEGKNPEYVSAAVAGALQQQFISKGVKFVLQTGDLSDRAGDAAPGARNAAAQSLYDAGIGFFPIRGNHETYGYLFGRDPNYTLNVPAFKEAFTQNQGTPNWGATNFSWPSSSKDVLKGLSYAFDYNNASFVMVDVEQTSVKHQAAPNNPASCTNAIAPGTPAGTTPYCGQGYYYMLSHLGYYDTSWVVYQAAYDITNGYTVVYDEYGVGGPNVNITIPAGSWFRIASREGRPTTNFNGWDVPNPLQTYNGAPFDINDPPSIAANRILEKNSSANTEFWPDKQQTWVSGRLDKNTRGTEHAFVLSHRGIIAEEHTDSFFGTDSTVNTGGMQDTFMATLANNGVKYMISAHDHIHNRALIASPNGSSQVQQIITTGASTKYYEPAPLSSFAAGVKARETQISQEILNIGYYIYTVDGPRVTVDYYSDATGNFMNDADYPYGDASVPARLYMPNFDFVKKESFGYSTNGLQFKVAQGESYTGVGDTFGSTTASILAGKNNSTAADNSTDIVDEVTVSAPRPFVKVVNTGWVAKNNPMLASDILSLWGMADFGTELTDVYVLQMSYQEERVNGKFQGNGGYRLATLDSTGKWVKAVDMNIGGKGQKFVKGPYNGSLQVGTHGIDMENHVVWAVINYNADFAAVKF